MLFQGKKCKKSSPSYIIDSIYEDGSDGMLRLNLIYMWCFSKLTSSCTEKYSSREKQTQIAE